MSINAVSPDQLDEIFSALANATRRNILATLAEGEASVSELAEPFDISLPAISRHIKVLERAGLISQGQRAQSRPCTFNAKALDPVQEWAEQCRATWHASFDRLDSYLEQLQPSTNKQPSRRNQTPTDSKKEATQ